MRGERPREQLPRQIGRYVLHHQFASGGMAAVYFGQLLGSVGFSRVVAIKRMHHDFASNAAFVNMFVDEAWLAARVQHPNVVQTIDVVADAGELFIVMDYVRGEALSSLLRDARAAVPTSVAASVVCQALAGLHAAHEAKDEAGRPLGMIHRDVSPQNVLVGVDGLARITDFGIAKAASRLHVTQEKQIKGKLRYMPPEQITSDAKLDRRADIYAMGVVLWETLAGQRLFRGETVEELLLSIMREQVPRLSERRNDVPREVDDVIARAVARDPNARFATAEAFQIALESAVVPASARAIGEWVVGVAGPSLLEKRAVIDLIEQNAASRTSVRAEVERLADRTGGDDATVVGPPPVMGSDSSPQVRASPSDETRVSRQAAGAPHSATDNTVAGPTALPDGHGRDAAPTLARPAGTEPAPTVRRSGAAQPEPPFSAGPSPTLALTAVSGPRPPSPAAPTLVNAPIRAAVTSDSTVSGYIALPHAVPLPVPARQGRGGLAVAVALLAVGAAALATVLLLGDSAPPGEKRPAVAPTPSGPQTSVDPPDGSAPSSEPSAATVPASASPQPSAVPPDSSASAPVSSSSPNTRPSSPAGRPKQSEPGSKVHIPSDDSL